MRIARVSERGPSAVSSAMSSALGTILRGKKRGGEEEGVSNSGRDVFLGGRGRGELRSGEVRRGVVGEQIADSWKVERRTQWENGRKEEVDTGGK